MVSKTLTIMFVDVQGFTSRTSLQTREENQLFIKEVKEFVEKYVQDKQGKLIKTMGDGFLVTFESPTNAVACGIAIQKEIERRNSNVLNENNWVKFRVGISTGEVTVDENSDVYGEAVNIAARIQKFAQPNDVFISDSTYLAMNKSEIKTKDLGPQKFKNVLQQVRVYRVLNDNRSRDKVNRENKVRKIVFAVSIIILSVTALSILHTIKTNKKAKPDGVINKTSSRGDFSDLALLKLLSEKKFDKAAALGEKLIKSDPVNSRLLGLTGYSYIQLGNLTKAREYIEKAIALNPDNPAFHKLLTAVSNREKRLLK